jgi:nucleoside-diphosphate-sugar epimerase
MTNVLFIGGTGLISSECAARAMQSGCKVHILTRGKRPLDFPAGMQPTAIHADITDPAAVEIALAGKTFDCVVNFIAYKPEEVARDIKLFTRRTAQYILISSASCYQKPPANFIVTEQTPLSNPFWQYARDKIACEEILMNAHREQKFPATIVRPSLTYGKSRIPGAYHNSAMSWTTTARFLTGKSVIVHGDGTSLWQVTHAADVAKGLAGLLGNPKAVGESFHITTDEVLTWNRIMETQAEILGVKPNLIHIPSEFIAHFDPDRAAGLLGDKQHSVVCDNSKIKKFVPSFVATIKLAEGLRETLNWFRADKSRQMIDEKFDALTDKIIAAYQRGLT